MNFFSSSASRLILPVRKNATPTAIPPRPLSASGKYASTEGRFTIIDENSVISKWYIAVQMANTVHGYGLLQQHI
ncbi:unnamed protein product [Toxocara canis]|uniref:Uncharacterized protein n=1 Tax=Toxocara canis TaxID=6265 RepID=A0A183UTW6_TOXCA|nr:unnamed protein product [Toxocara canis]